jgi:hypothetical protein
MAPKMSAMDLFKKGAKGPEPKKKSATPAVTLEGHDEAIQDWMQANADMKSAEARKVAAEAKFLDSAEGLRLSECQRDGKYHSSVKLNEKILYGVQNRYSAIPSEDQEKLDEVFGDKSEQFFKPKMEISLTQAALSDEKILEKLIGAVGADNLKTYFDIEQHISPTETFHEARSTNPEVAVKANKLIDAGVLKPAKASCKLA